jgi:hypothetical protein
VAEVGGGYLDKIECLQVQKILTGERHFYDDLLDLKEIQGIISAFF